MNNHLVLYKFQKDNKNYVMKSIDPNIISSKQLIFWKKLNKQLKFKMWSFQHEFLKYYKSYISRVETFIENDINICPICGYEDKEKRIYYDLYYYICWGSLTYHMIKEHNFKPHDRLIDSIISLSTIQYFKLKRNDLIFFEGLMYAGGRQKKFKYTEKKYDKDEIDYDKKRLYVYSEYSGFLDVKCQPRYCELDNIITLSKDRVFDGEEIYLMFYLDKRMKTKQYMFHTHPPTPKAGSRIQTDHLVYEIPSPGDINKFARIKCQYSHVEGSIIFAPEGVYAIMVKDRKKPVHNFDLKDFDHQAYVNSIENSYNKYGFINNEIDFYKNVLYDFSHVNALNKIVDKYNLKIAYYPKELNHENKYVYGKLFLPYNEEKNDHEKNEDDIFDE